MGLKIITDDKPVTVYRIDKETQSGYKYSTYSLGVSSKNVDGSWLNGFIDCQFKKGVEVPNKSKIIINNSFYTVSEYNGRKFYKVFITDFAMAEENEQAKPVSASNIDDWMSIPDGAEELPFN